MTYRRLPAVSSSRRRTNTTIIPNRTITSDAPCTNPRGSVISNRTTKVPPNNRCKQNLGATRCTCACHTIVLVTPVSEFSNTSKQRVYLIDHDPSYHSVRVILKKNCLGPQTSASNFSGCLFAKERPIESDALSVNSKTNCNDHTRNFLVRRKI